ncbi:hypothetical protein B0H17DRAFT_1204364 [Mycena rosella]|uniref:Uncharacterized protein n=1 Tax=Mycena rosella TaxID=1033263 RepID=A0AAD7GDW1_MYCRO|nr:hypothetical protein B0H17DRAFT_1204364 [Mycena rosella]
MRIPFFVPAFVLAAAAAVVADKCAVCPTTLLPGVTEILWTLVFNRNVAENVMFCGFRGKGRNNSTAQTFCTYNDNNGIFIANDMSLQACPKKVKVVDC